ncbi:carbon storage regulator [Photobacterium sp. DNB23_23_1]|uniref:Carbon storage regulator n=1 Tax=Photobacterium pectinilyticum TaxID=2906793 RepID=A0ABT1N394_9GAMM|nr:carbon storage regulator [Photobacterium sp. ZSDE20]MCQ1059185.1 carbon storage regulator [Photobacterium sp. ZSDE20]MDD1824837.1 carbon storage regulator [Photobacterium sp. ZSDE20]
MKYLTLMVVAFISYSAAAAEELDILANSEQLSEEFMTHSRGGEYELETDTLQASSEMYGDVTGNSAYNNTTGNNILDGGALSNSSGVYNIVQNTGSNVLIQNATVINLTLK